MYLYFVEYWIRGFLVRGLYSNYFEKSILPKKRLKASRDHKSYESRLIECINNRESKKIELSEFGKV